MHQSTITQRQAFEFKCLSKVLRISRIKINKNTDILQDANMDENWLINSTMYREIIAPTGTGVDIFVHIYNAVVLYEFSTCSDSLNRFYTQVMTQL